MRDHVKKRDDELLVVHTSRGAAADRTGCEPVAPSAEALPADVEQLAARLGTTTDAGARARLLGAIQHRFGNAFAARVVEALERAGSPPPSPGADAPGRDTDR